MPSVCSGQKEIEPVRISANEMLGGGASYRGAIHFTNANGDLAKLAGTVGVFEHDTDADDNVVSKASGMGIV